MKTLLTLLILSFLLVACTEDKKAETSEAPKKPTESMQADALADAGGIAEENDMCICTKDYRPVCGKNGQTYPNPCQAGCEKVEIASEGPCEEK